MSQRFKLPLPAADPYDRWERLAMLLKLCIASTRIRGVPAPLNLVFVGPPGDGKTEMLMRARHVQHVTVLSDASYTGLLDFLAQVRDREKSCLLLPDLATIVGRKAEVARQALATMASMAAEGVHRTAVGRQVKDFRGAQASVVTAITTREFEQHMSILGQNAFLSRCFICDFDLELPELEAMMRRHQEGRRELLKPLWHARRNGKPAQLAMKTVNINAAKVEQTMSWWKELRDLRPDMFYGFRSGHALQTLLRSAAYLDGRAKVTMADVKTVERMLPLLFAQVLTRRDAQ